MKKPATTSQPVHSLIHERWSPRAFNGESLTRADMDACFEAARWAASCFNEQPWHFLVAHREETAVFNEALECLVPGNREWACHAGVLIIAFVKDRFKMTGEENAHAEYDTGQAVAQMTLQAWSLGIVAHQMGGFVAEEVTRRFATPEGYRPFVAIALGRQGAAECLTPEKAEWERAPRVRKSLDEVRQPFVCEKPEE